MNRALKRVEDQQKDQVALAERQFLQLKQQTIRGIGFNCCSRYFKFICSRHWQPFYLVSVI